MPTKRLNNILRASLPNQRWLWISYALIVLGSIYLAAAWHFAFAALPFVFLLFYVSIVDIKAVFFFLWAFIPLSTEYVFPNGFGTDLPTEPLIIGLMLLGVIYFISNPKKVDARIFTHPLSLILLAHIAWTTFTALTSPNPLVSFKFLLAKVWYVVTFYYLASLMIKEVKDVKKIFWLVFVPMVFMVAYVWYKHSAYHFSFSTVNKAMSPFNRNHVNYAAIITLFFPWVAMALRWYRKGSIARWILWGAAVFLMGAIYLSYTRAAYVSLGIAFGLWVVVELRAMKLAIIVALIGALIGVGYLVQQNRYLEMAPDYNKAITHKDFDNLILATAKGQDVSTMERVYRWVAGFRMVGARPIVGHGSGNFYNYYESYTVTSFITYVSDNKEKSGIHSYYLMIMVDQGIPGLIIFVALIAYALMMFQRLYHSYRDKEERTVILIAGLSLGVILAFLLINDLIETDKSGSFFFLALAILLSWDLKLLHKGRT